MKAFSSDGSRWFSRDHGELWDSWCESPEFCEWLRASREACSGDLAFGTRARPMDRVRGARVIAICAALYRLFHAGRVSIEIAHQLRQALRGLSS